MTGKQIEADITAGLWKPPENKLLLTELEQWIADRQDDPVDDWDRGYRSAINALSTFVRNYKKG